MELPISIHTMYLYQHGAIEGRTEIRKFNEASLIYDQAADKLLDETLKLLGSSLKMRKYSAQILMKSKKYMPIMIESQLNWAYFQIHQNHHHFKAYINHKYVTHIEGTDEFVMITFLDGSTIQFKQKLKFVQKQYERCLCLVDVQYKIIKRQSMYDCR